MRDERSTVRQGNPAGPIVGVPGRTTLLERLLLTDLRGYRALELELTPGPHLLHGPNAAARANGREASLPVAIETADILFGIDADGDTLATALIVTAIPAKEWA